MHRTGTKHIVRHMQNSSYTYDEYLICIGLGPSISSVICKNPSYSGPSYPGSPVYHDDLQNVCQNHLTFLIHYSPVFYMYTSYFIISGMKAAGNIQVTTTLSTSKNMMLKLGKLKFELLQTHTRYSGISGVI